MKLFAIIASIFISCSVSQAQDWASATEPQENVISLAEEDPNEGKIPVSEREIPETVMNAFRSSVFQHMEIVQVFRLQDRALDEVIIGDTLAQPFYLFEFRLSYQGKTFCQYFTPNGDLYVKNGPV